METNLSDHDCILVSDFFCVKSHGWSCAVITFLKMMSINRLKYKVCSFSSILFYWSLTGYRSIKGWDAFVLLKEEWCKDTSVVYEHLRCQCQKGEHILIMLSLSSLKQVVTLGLPFRAVRQNKKEDYRGREGSEDKKRGGIRWKRNLMAVCLPTPSWPAYD